MSGRALLAICVLGTIASAQEQKIYRVFATVPLGNEMVAECETKGEYNVKGCKLLNGHDLDDLVNAFMELEKRQSDDHMALIRDYEKHLRGDIALAKKIQRIQNQAKKDLGEAGQR